MPAHPTPTRPLPTWAVWLITLTALAALNLGAPALASLVGALL